MKQAMFLLLTVLQNLLWGQAPYLNECAAGKIKYYQHIKDKYGNMNARYPGDNSIDVTYYKLDLKITYSPKKITGNVTINFKATQNGVSSVFIDLDNELDVDSIKSESQKLSFTHTADKINITLIQILNTGDAAQMIVYYHGTPANSGFGSFAFSTHGDNQVIWSLSEPYGAPDWWPCKDDPSDKADSTDVWITAPKKFVTVSNGILEKVIDHGALKTYRWKNRYPIANYLVSVAMTNYQEYNIYYHYTPTDSMLISSFVYPENLTEDNKQKINDIPNMLTCFGERFGLYPFIKEKYGLAQFGWSGGMEHQTCTSINNFGTNLVSHELTHQWFGDKITCATWRHIWLNEGFATYGETLYDGYINGNGSYQAFIQYYMNKAKNANGSIYVENIGSVNEIFNSDRTYAKGGCVLHMLRGIVGDSTFFNILKTYASSDVAYGSAVTEDFQASAEQVSGLDLDYFFQEWIYGYNYPKYNITANFQNLGSQWGATVNISQQTNSNPAFFTMPIQLKFTFDDHSDTMVTVLNNQSSQLFNFQFLKHPVNMVFDPGNWILKDIKSMTVGIDQHTFGEEVSWNIYPNPAKESFWLEGFSDNAEPLNVQVMDITGKVIFVLPEKIGHGVFHEKIDIKGLADGLYFIAIKDSEKQAVKKLVVVKN